MKISSTK